MATIGVTRGLGDHDLKVYNSNIYIKPFLSCVPEVSVSSRLSVAAVATLEGLGYIQKAVFSFIQGLGLIYV